MQTLILCSGNVFRSPLAAGFLVRRLDELGVDAGVSSAGLLSGGQPVPERLMELGRRMGLDLSGHRSRRFDVEDLKEADLVLGMAREHAREAVMTLPEVWPRCFTLKELVRRGWHVGQRRPRQSVEAWLGSSHQGRRHADLLGSSNDDDVEDPAGASDQRLEATAQEISGLVERLVRLLWPPQAL